MRRALVLAERGWGQVHPNPLVGALIVREHQVVGQGWHAGFGAAHAERVALDQAGESARGATLYCTLEPCTHHGKQPPCADAVIAAGIRRVVVAMRDPDPVAAGGLARLRAAGVEVHEGVREDHARRLNFRFLQRFTERQRPHVAVKLAVTMDGYIADRDGNARWISGAEARDWVHRERAGYAAIGVGATTAIRDDARLTVRGAVTPRVPPTRVLFDRSGVLPADHPMFATVDEAPVLVVGAEDRIAGPLPSGVSHLAATSLGDALAGLARAGLDALLVEGGGRLAGSLLREGLVDRIYQIQAPVWLGTGHPAWAHLPEHTLPTAPRWHTILRRRLGDDTLLVLEP